MKPPIEYRPNKNMPPSVTPSAPVRRGKDAGSTPASGTKFDKAAYQAKYMREVYRPRVKARKAAAHG